MGSDCLTLAPRRSYPTGNRGDGRAQWRSLGIDEAMDTTLHNHILERLLADNDLEGLAVNLVDAACQGPTRLEEALQGRPVERERPTPDRKATAVIEPPGAYLESITVEGFRGVGPETKLSLTPGPGLTLVVGRNGTGKSTFAEGLETLLTGQCGRWSAARSKLWQQGWRNLHAQGPARVQAIVGGRRASAHPDDPEMGSGCRPRRIRT